MPIGTTYAIDLLYEIPGKQGIMTAHVTQLTTGPSAAVQDAQYAYTEVAGVIAGNLANLMPDQISFLGAYVKQATIGTGVVYPFLGLFASPIVGLRGTGEILPEGQGPLCLLGPTTFSVNPRRQTNRKYLPVMLESDQVDGAIDSLLAEDCVSYWENIITTLDTAADFQLVTYSPTEDAALATAAWPVGVIRVSDQIARVVRRRPKYQGRS